MEAFFYTWIAIVVVLLVWFYTPSGAPLANRVFCSLFIILTLWMLEAGFFFGLRPSMSGQGSLLFVLIWFMLSGIQLLCFLFGLYNTVIWKVQRWKAAIPMSIILVTVVTTDILIWRYIGQYSN